MREWTLKITLGATVPGALLLASPAQAQGMDDDFWVELAGFWPNVDTDVTVSSVTNGTTGTDIDLETDLNLDDSELLPAVFAGARLGGGFIVGAEYYSLGRDAPVTLARAITVDDVTYPVNANLTSEFNTDIYRLTVGWAFVRNETVEIGAALGLHATDIELSIDGQGSVGGAPVQVQNRRRDVLAPLPTVGLFATFEILPRLTIGGRIDYLSLNVGDYDGRLINTQVSATYRIFRNVGIGAAYRYVDYRVDVEKDTYTARFAYEFNGPALFLQFGF